MQRYCGFQSQSKQTPVVHKPGETKFSRDRKFVMAGRSTVYGKQSAQDFRKDSRRTLTMSLSESLCPEDYVVPDVQGVMSGFAGDRVEEKTFIGKSSYQLSFPNYKENLNEFLSKSDADFRTAFENIDSSGSGYIQVSDISKLLQSVLGPESPQRISDLVKRPFEYKGALCNWSQFLSALENAREQESNTTNARAAPPTWLKPAPSHMPSANAKPIASRYMTDMGEYRKSPRKRPIMLGTNKMASTTSDLAYGTTKNATHIPGYSGYIGGRGYTESDIRSDTKNNLQNTFRQNVEGYTGHVPSSCNNARGPVSMINSATTSGSAYTTYKLQA